MPYYTSRPINERSETMSFQNWTHEDVMKADVPTLISYIRWNDHNSCISLFDPNEVCGDCQTVHMKLNQKELAESIIHGWM